MSERDKAIANITAVDRAYDGRAEYYVGRGWNAALAKQNAEAEKWIPIRTAEDLPERCKNVLLTTKDLGYVLKGYFIRENHPRGDVWVVGSANGNCYFGLDTVTAWMPLPAPYLEQAEGGEE